MSARSRKPREALPRAAIDAALAELARRAATSRSLAEALKEQLSVLEALLGPRTMWVATWDAARGQLGVEAVRGRNDARVAAVRPGEGIVGRAFAERSCQREGAVEAIPVLSDEGPLGVLVLVGARAHLQDDVKRVVGAQLAAAWQVAQLRDDATQRSAALERAVAGIRQLEQAQAELLSDVSHALKNPLTALKTYVGMVRRERLGAVTERQAAALEAADRSADALTRMINDLVLMSQLRTGNMQLHARPFGLRALTSETVERLLGTAGLGRVQLSSGGREVFVRGDRERLGEALAHLLEVAIELAADGSVVRACVGALATEVAQLQLHASGTPLGDEAISTLFDAFARARSSRKLGRGTGLGLPIAARVLELHSGQVQVSRAGDETTFTVTLPLYAGALPGVDGQSTPRAGGVLVVDDDAACRVALLELLRAEGFQAEGASSADEALRALAVGAAPALVLLDYALGAETGLSVLRHMKGEQRLAEVPVFAMSGAPGGPSLASGAGPVRVDGFLEKPVQPGRLLDVVRSLVSPSSAPAGR